MVKCVVVADDLTGANATGVLLKKYNLDTVSLLNMENFDIKKFKEDALLYPTDTRKTSAKVAYDRVYKATKLMKDKDVKVYGKRIDSTLRGNMGPEIDAMLEALGEKKRIALVAPIFPSSGRVCVGGYLLVNGIALQNTSVAKDPQSPITTSIVEKLLKKQSKYKVSSIYLDKVYEGVDALAKEIKKRADKGDRVIILDAITDEDMGVLADAAIKSGVPFISVDPGVFTAEVAYRLVAKEKETKQQKKGKILMAVGSITPLTKQQLDYVQASYGQELKSVEIITERFFDSKEREEEISRVSNEILKAKDYEIFCVHFDSVNPETRINLDDKAKELKRPKEELFTVLNSAIAEICYRICKGDKSFKAVYSTGGDITIAICERFKTNGINLLAEIIPLAAYGKFVGGLFPGMNIVTKGGMIGDKTGAKVCVEALRKAINE